MNLWLILALLFWVLAIGSYFIGRKSYILFSIFDGLLLAFLCFKFLPEAFLQVNFWQGAAGLLFGALLGSAAEQCSKLQAVFSSPLWHSGIFSAAVLFFEKGIKAGASCGNMAIFLLLLTGGFFLSISCSGILPERDNPKEKAAAGILGAAGFMLGTWQLSIFLIF